MYKAQVIKMALVALKFSSSVSHVTCTIGWSCRNYIRIKMNTRVLKTLNFLKADTGFIRTTVDYNTAVKWFTENLYAIIY